MIGRLGWLVGGMVAGGLIAAGLIMGGVALVRGPEQVAGGVPGFVEEPGAGIDHAYQGDFNFFVGGGVAAFDCDDDRKPELFFAGGSDQAALYRNESGVGLALSFNRVSDDATDLTNVTGAYPIDVDSDGITDLAVLRLGGNVMLRGLGDCRFEDATTEWGVDPGDEWTVAFSAQWESGKDMPTLAFGNYVALDDAGESTGSCSDSYLFRPGEAGYTAPTSLSPGWCTLSILFSDWGRTGQRDLRLTNDRHYYVDGEEQMWEIPAGDEPRLYTAEDGWQSMKIWGMGIATQDITGDGHPEVYLTSQGDNKLQTLVETARPNYTDIALSRGATAHRPFEGDTDLPSTAWHAQFEDVNNDTIADLFVTKGNVDSMPEFAQQDPNNLLLGQVDGSFVEAAGGAGLLDFATSRGAAVVDLNLDGLLDVVVVERAEPVKVWRNVGSETEGSMGNWLAIDLEQAGPNGDAIGAWIEVETDRSLYEREVIVGGGHAGGQLGWSHFGLGPAGEARVRVVWPDGEAGRWMTVDADQFLVIERDAAEPVPWVPGGR